MGSIIRFLKWIDSIETLYEGDVIALENAGYEIAYQTTSDNWYVISYAEGFNIIYQKSIMAEGFVANLLIEYPQELQNKYEPIVEHAADTFVIRE